MAKTNAEAKKEGNKLISALKRPFVGIARAFRDMVAELKKVTWASRQDLINYSVVVLLFMLFMGIVIGLFDGGASWLVRLIVGQ